MQPEDKSFFKNRKVIIIIAIIIILFLLFIVLYYINTKSKVPDNNIVENNNSSISNTQISISIAEYLALNPDAKYKNISEIDKNGDGVINSLDGIDVNALYNSNTNISDNNLNSDSNFINADGNNFNSSNASSSDFNFNNNSNSTSSFSDNNFDATSSDFNADNFKFDAAANNKSGYFNLGDFIYNGADTFVNGDTNSNSNWSADNANNSNNYTDYKTTDGLGGFTDIDKWLEDNFGHKIFNENSKIDDIENPQTPINENKLSSTEGIFWNTAGQSNPDTNITEINSLYFFYYTSSKTFWFCIDKGNTEKVCDKADSNNWVKVINDGSLYNYNSGSLTAKYNLLGNWFFTLNFNQDLYGKKSLEQNKLSLSRIYFKDKQSSTDNPNYLIVVH